ncbi:calcyphosin-like protein [Limulus polyphemus]|uniref:Calcyphosin-like protein n=1 Tax=Limulus polyphemus TaxID=6850 RepID=A0ABM1B803_LIMPO|nr:calcyphosin-like protein [Limulus polyphemus]
MPRPVTAETRNEKEMIESAKKQFAFATDPVEKLKLLCLQRGSSGILGLGRVFRRMDDNGNGDLSKDEFIKGLNDTGLGESFPPEEIEELFSRFDADSSGKIVFNEFLRAIRPSMSKGRIDIVEKAFSKLDKTGDGMINVQDLKGVYNVRNHPAYLNGEMTEKQLLTKFLRKFEEEGDINGVVTKEEFFDYYNGVSASIDEDAYFDLMMRNCWKL